MNSPILAIFDSGVDIGIVLLVVLLLFGGTRLPHLARSLGSAQKEFKKGLEEGAKPDAAPKSAAAIAETKTTPVIVETKAPVIVETKATPPAVN